jgi:hypothetical protein
VDVPDNDGAKLQQHLKVISQGTKSTE